ncbi:MAG: iron ABC transporter permease [archaeon]|nr:iron ABC transporter permease [archaeon]
MSMKENYHQYTRRKLIFILICVIGLFLAFGTSIAIKNSELNFFDSFRIIYEHLTGVTYEKYSDPWLDDYVVWNHRLPRTLYAILAGAALGVAGAAMQSVMHNPLADPYTTGISSGAEFGVSVSMILGIDLISIGIVKDLGVMMNAFIFALIPMVLMVMISPKTRSNPSTLILVGVAVTYLFNSINMFLMVTTDADTMSNVYLWLVGSLNSISWSYFPLSLTITVVGTAVIMLLSNKLNILALEDSNAKTLGINADNVRIICLLVISLMVATITCYVGIIGFVGLVCPHIVRTIIDADNKYLIPASAVFSGLFLMSADILARLVSPHGTVPVGIVMSFIGAPIFLYLLVRRNANVW